jgi:FlaG/FlaF family flagellin (archaellin)
MKAIGKLSAFGATALSALAVAQFSSVGLAHAATDPTYFSNSDGSMEVIYSGGGLANYATIVDSRNPEGSTEFCHYHSTGVQGTIALPYDADTTVTGPHPSSPITIIFQAIGGRYSVNVTCNNTGNSAAFSPVVLVS